MIASTIQLLHLYPEGAFCHGISVNFSLSGHCHEKNPDGSYGKEKYFDDHYESATAVTEGHSEGGTEDPEVLTQSSARDPSFLRLESKSALQNQFWQLKRFLDFSEDLSIFHWEAMFSPLCPESNK